MIGKPQVLLKWTEVNIEESLQINNLSLLYGAWESLLNCTVSLLGHCLHSLLPAHLSAHSHSQRFDVLFTHRHKHTDGNDKTCTIRVSYLFCVNGVSFSARIMEQRRFIRCDLTTGLGFPHWFTVVSLPYCTVIAFTELSGMYSKMKTTDGEGSFFNAAKAEAYWLVF